MTDAKAKQELISLFGKESSNPLSAIAIRPKGVRFESQNRNEEVYILLRQHWVTNIPWIIKVIIGLVSILGFAMFYVSNAVPEVQEMLTYSQMVLVCVVGYLLISTYSFLSFLRWFFNAYIVTDERILDLDFHGILHHRISEANLMNIEDVSSSHVGVWQTIFDYGPVQIQTAAEKLELRFENVPNPGFVQDKIMDMASVVKCRRH